ncbi:MAG: TIGR03086 family metal-binding protein [Nocardioidaceae bacterium]
MSDISARYARLAATMTDKIGQVPDDRWESPSPCEGWVARDLVQHLVDTHGMFAGLVGLELTPGPAVGDDPAGAWASARAQMQAWLDDPATAGREFDGLGGRTMFEAAVNRFICFDLLVHGWDLSRAAGLDETIDPAELPNLWDDTEAFGEMIRSEGTCGPEVEAPADATGQERLLAYLGRQPR